MSESIKEIKEELSRLRAQTKTLYAARTDLREDKKDIDGVRQKIDRYQLVIGSIKAGYN